MGNEKRALISVTDKEGVVEFARDLTEIGFEIVSTGGTASCIREAGIDVTDVSQVTGFVEILDGRVKTLHPKIHGGILARRDVQSHNDQLAEHDIAAFDIVAVNLYAFERAAADPAATLDAVIEQIDIGGPTLLRAAAKNHAHVAVVVDPRDYDAVVHDFRNGEGPDIATRRAYALKVFRHTAHYDRAVSEYLTRHASDEDPVLPETLTLQFHKVRDLRYGENPHQRAAFYREADPTPGALAQAELLWGKPLSFNNLLDADSAYNLAMDLGESAAVYVKHNNPCGAAQHHNLVDAIQIARACDPVSAFGAVVALGRPVDIDAARALSETFIEVIIAPAFDEDALAVLKKKKNLRLLATGSFTRPLDGGRDVRRIGGGLLAQTRDVRPDPLAEIERAKVVTKRAPTDEERAALSFVWLVAKHVRSNAIVFGHADRVVAVGAGQMSRVDAVRLCELKGGDALKRTVVASDAFFPFRDGVDILAEAGATAVVQPGGSIRDEEVIAAADEHGLAMLATGVRHFRH